MSPSSRDTAWIAHEFDRRAATYDHSELKRWQADQAVQLLRPCSPYDHWLEYGFLDELRNAPTETAHAVYDSYQAAYRELQIAGSAQHVAMFTRCAFAESWRHLRAE